MRPPSLLSAPILASLLACLFCTDSGRAQESRPRAEDPIAQLRDVLSRELKDEGGAAAQRADAKAWLDAHGAADFGDGGFLHALATHVAAATPAERIPAQDVVHRIVEARGGFPVAGFDKTARTTLLLIGLRHAEAGEWDACRKYLPTLLRHYPDHAAVYWLVGRRARDHGSAEGKAFLHQVIVPEILSSPTLDDIDRVAELRRLWEVDYTGPRPFSHVEGPGLDGRTVATREFAGRVLLVDYWATWCKPCLMEMPHVVEAWKRFGQKGLAVVGISIDDADRRAKVVETVERLGMGWPQIFDGKGAKTPLSTANRVSAIPATFLLDRRGRVRWTNLQGEELGRRIQELLDEKD